MIDHVTANVSDFERAKRFYVQALEPLGYSLHMEFDGAAVDAFHAAALAAGGTDNGEPGLRPHYHETYYAAFVHDPDGNNREAVCHRPE
jgi:catechol 2,3-dioxygenase-like lactoylglutathione lyase family enzyme